MPAIAVGSTSIPPRSTATCATPRSASTANGFVALLEEVQRAGQEDRPGGVAGRERDREPHEPTPAARRQPPVREQQEQERDAADERRHPQHVGQHAERGAGRERARLGQQRVRRVAEQDVLERRATPVARNSQPIALRGCRVAMSTPTVGNASMTIDASASMAGEPSEPIDFGVSTPRLSTSERDADRGQGDRERHRPQASLPLRSGASNRARHDIVIVPDCLRAGASSARLLPGRPVIVTVADVAPVEVMLLGSPQVRRDGTAVAFDTRKALALLAHLALTDRARPRDVLAELLWPEHDAEHARGALRRTLSTLRGAVGAEAIDATRERVALVRGSGLEHRRRPLPRAGRRRRARGRGGSVPRRLPRGLRVA